MYLHIEKGASQQLHPVHRTYNDLKIITLKTVWGRTRPIPVRVVHMYLCTNLTCAFFLYVQMYILPGTGIFRCIYVYIQARHICVQVSSIRDPKVPFLQTLLGFLSLDDTGKNKIAFLLLWDPWSPVHIVNYFTHNHLWLVFILVILKVSISSSPVLMYRITCTCIFLCFFGALAQAFFCRKPTQGSY